MKNPPHVSAALDLPKTVKGIIAFGKSVVTALTGNTALPNPVPTVATLAADVAGLDASEALVLTRTMGAKESRDVKLAAVRSDLLQIKTYVETAANTNPATAQEVIRSAGLSVRKTTARNKADLAATQEPISGSVRLMAKSVAHRACYEWQYSTDQKTWTSATPTLQAKTVLVGLTPALSYFFRYRAVTKTGEGNWSQVVTLLAQ